MNLNLTPSFPTLSGELFDSLPESIRSYIRYLEATIQQQQARSYLTFHNKTSLLFSTVFRNQLNLPLQEWMRMDFLNHVLIRSKQSRIKVSMIIKLIQKVYFICMER